MSNYPPQQYGYYDSGNVNDEMDEMLNSLVGSNSHTMPPSHHGSSHYGPEYSNHNVNSIHVVLVELFFKKLLHVEQLL